jgi:hypothetical protein
MASLSLAKPIPDQVINEGASYKPFDFKVFLTSAGALGSLQFQADLADGQALPKGLICTQDGILSGIPAQGAEGSYRVRLKITDIEGGVLVTSFNLVIKPANVAQPHSLLRELKQQVWAAVGQGQPIPTMPDIDHLLGSSITAAEYYHLLERYAYLIIWDADNMSFPGELVKLNLMGASDKFQVYDRGSCIVASPKDLYTHDRTPHDALITSRAMAEEAFKRNWTIEFSGFDKMVRAACVRLHVLSAQHQRKVSILHYALQPDDMMIYSREVAADASKKPAPGQGPV